MASAGAAGTTCERRARTARVRRRGLLVLVVSSDLELADVLLSATRRRLQANPCYAFPLRVSAGRRATDRVEFAVSHRVFEALVADGEIVLAWSEGRYRGGLTREALAQLEAGHVVIAAAPLEAAADARRLWPNVEVVRMAGATDPVRVALTPRACLGRMMPAPLKRRSTALLRSREHALESGGIAGSVQRLTEAIAVLSAGR